MGHPEHNPRGRRKPKRVEARFVQEINAGGETITLARLTLLTGKPKALRVVLNAVRATGAVEVGIGHDRGRAVNTAMTLAANSGSLATIDSVEVGVHYTDLDDWIAQIDTQTRKLRVQVIATTQSTEAVAALARVATDTGASAADIVLVKCGTGLHKAPVLKPHHIVTAIEQQIETR